MTTNEPEADSRQTVDTCLGVSWGGAQPTAPYHNRAVLPAIAWLALLLLCHCSPVFPKEPLRWQPPVEREDGTLMGPEEVGGYELRAISASGEQIWHMALEDPTARQHTPPQILNAARFEISVYDTNGLYSVWVEIAPKPAELLRPPEQGWLEYAQPLPANRR